MPTSTRISPNSVALDESAIHFVIAYDIAADTVRSAVHRLLSGYGEPIQFSVFECWLAARDLRHLRRSLSCMSLAVGDHVEVFRCAEDGPRPQTAGDWWTA